MAGVTGTSQIDDAVEKMLAESRYTLQERPGVVKSCIRRERLPEHKGPAVNIPKYGTVTTYALTQGTDMAQAQQITDTLMTLTPAEYGAQVILTDMMLMEARDEFFKAAGKILAESFDRQQDQALCDDFDAYSKALGTAAAALTIGHIMAATASIQYNAPADATAGRGGEPAPGPIYGVFTPAQIHALNKTLVGGLGAAAATQVTPETERARAIGTEFTIPGVGITIKSDVNITKDTSDDAKGAVFSREAQILVELGSAPSVEKERDASLRAWELNFVGRWARGEYKDVWGREMLFDSALPTS